MSALSASFLRALRHVGISDHSLQLLLLISCLVWVSIDAGAQTRPEPFRFGEVDRELLDQIKQLDKKFEEQGLVYRDPESNAYVNRLGQSLLKPEDQLENVVWQFRILRNSSLNAFALPNGSIYVHTGLLARLETEAQLAGVLAHEIIHVRNRHSYLGYRSYRKKMLTINLLAAAGGYTGVIGLGTSLAVQFVLAVSVVGHSRELEKEADMEGMQRMIGSAYDPQAAIDALKCFLEKYEVDLAGEPFYGDHPKTKDRIAYLQELLANSSSKREGQPSSDGSSKEKYQKTVADVTRHNIQLAIDDGFYRTAVTMGKRLTAVLPEAANWAALAGAYAALGPRPYEPTAAEKTGQGKREARKRRSKLTLQEEDRALAATPAGQELQKANFAEAEKLYRRAVEMDPQYALAWRGWGELFENQAQSQPAIEAYRKYIELQPAAMDRLLVMRRIKTLEAKLPGATTHQQ